MYKYITEQGKALQQQPYQQYQGQLVPDINATQQAGINQAQQYSQAAQPGYQAGYGATNTAMNQIAQGQNVAQPYYGAATDLTGAAAQQAGMNMNAAQPAYQAGYGAAGQAQDILNQGLGVAQPYFQGAQTFAAGTMPQYQEAAGAAQAGMRPLMQSTYAAQPSYQAAQMGTMGAAGGLGQTIGGLGGISQGYNAPNYAAGVQGYMNPYLQNAMGSTAAMMQNQNQQQQQQLQGSAIQQGAFGGDRGKVAQAALMGQQNLAMGQTLGQMANTGYQSAAQNYLSGLGAQAGIAGQQGSMYGQIGGLANQYGQLGGQAQQALINAGQAQQQGAANIANIAGQGMGAAGQYGALGTAAQNAALQGMPLAQQQASLYGQLGTGAQNAAMQGAQQLGALGAQYGQLGTSAQNAALQTVPMSLAAGAQYGQLGAGAQTAGMTGAQQLSAAGAIPYAVQQAQNAAAYQQFAQQQAYPFQTLGSLANMASGLGAGQGGTSTATTPAPNPMNAALGLGTSLLGYMTPSDERLKENMEPIGKTFDGQNLYKYNYKGDPRTQIGLSAQEVEKRNPNAVYRRDDGMRVVDYNDATNKAADRGHFAAGGSSMGGLVPESMERRPFASGGSQFTQIPYADDPLAEEMAALAKITLGSYIPQMKEIKAGGSMPIPTAHPYDAPTFDTSGIEGFGKAYKKYSLATAPSSVLPSYISGDSGIGGTLGQSMYATGGLVPRIPHADGSSADPEKTVSADQGFLGGLGSSISKGLGGVFGSDTQPGFISSTFNKGQPLSDDARQAMMAAGFGMMASPSPFLTQAIGQGGLTGMNTYAKQRQIDYETQKALAEQALRGREIGVQEQGNVYKGKEVENAIITNRMTALQQLRMQKASYIENGQPVPENIQSGIDSLASSLATFGVSGAGGTPVSAIAAPAAVAGAAVAAPKPQEAPPVTAPAPSVSATPAPAVSAPKPAEAPAVVAPEVKEQPKTAVPAEPERYGLPKINDPSFLTSLDPNNNPKTLRDRAALISGDDPRAAEKLREQATKAQDTMLEKGVGVGPNGELIKVPGWDQWKSMQENVKSNADWFNKQASDALSRQNSRQQLASISKIVENFKPNAFAEQFANIQSSLDAIGIPVPDSAKVNAVAFQSFLKDTLRQIYSDVKQYSGGVKVAELAGLEKQAPSATLQPGTVENIMSQLQGSLNFADKHFYDALDFRNKNKGAFDQADFEGEFNKKNNLTKYTDDALKDIAVYGAAPTNKASFVPGKTYILDQGPNGEPVKPHKKRFIKFSAKGNPIFADVE